MLLFVAWIAGCAAPEAPKGGGDEGDAFLRDGSVRITSPTNGETVADRLRVEFDAGGAVEMARLFVDGSAAEQENAVAGGGSFVTHLESGRHKLDLVGYDAEGELLSTYSITVRVADPEATWVTVTSPADGATVPNPVRFVVGASTDVEEVTLYADDHELGTVNGEGLLTYTFEGTGYPRHIRAVGSTDGVVLAEDELTITVSEGTTPSTSSWNEVVNSLIDTYPRDGSYAYWWPDDTDWYGTTRDVEYRGQLVAEGDPEHRSYCVGLTWEVMMRAFDQVNREEGGDGTLNGMSVADLDEFRIDWFVRDLWGDGVVTAVESYGVGERVTNLEDVRPGDFLQFWRHSGSGHSNIFVEWVRDGDEIVGVTYWSVQGSTDGIDFNTEYFGSTGSTIDPNHFFAARVYMPEDWVDWPSGG